MTETKTTPDWVKHAVFYQIFPERFANGDPTNDPENVQPWGTPPTTTNFMGGDLQGIIDHLDYLRDLGITALYLNPIFRASSNHKYNTYDYMQIDPHFGDLPTFQRLLAAAHQRGMRVVLDGVFNHCGRGFFAFHDVLENESASPYRNWFHIEAFPLHPYDESKPRNYHAWWNIRSLPKFNTDHPPVRRYLLNVARYWLEQGIDGWRLDVPDEIADHSFWREFRQVVKSANPEAYIVGEIWEDATPWFDGSQFDAVMNYLFRAPCRDFFAHRKIDAATFAAQIAAVLQMYPREHTLVQLNLLGSHDTARFLHEAENDVNRLYPAILFQMTYPGAPCVYYGDEIGLTGGEEPGSRACFPWEEQHWNRDLRTWVQRCIALRHAHPALRTGDYQTLLAEEGGQMYAFARWNDTDYLVVVLNPTSEPLNLSLALPDLADGVVLHDELNQASYTTLQGVLPDICLPAYGGAVLRRA